MPKAKIPKKAPVRKPASRSRISKRKRKPSQHMWYRQLLPSKRFFYYGLLLLFCALLVWVVILDFQVRGKFEGKKWAIPARVYARPLELYEGLLLKPAELKRELSSLGYAHVKQLFQPGQFSLQGLRYEIFTRDFTFSDKAEQAARYSVVFSDDAKSTVKQLIGAGDDLLVRIEPKAIGSIYPRHGEDRILVKLDETPPLLGQTLIAVEDKNFAHHYGISVRGIARAMLANIKAGRFVQGGSTLTQQLVKNFYLSQEKKLWRKIQEALMAPLLELHYSKAEILEAYINEVYLGQSGPRAIHGFGLAAKHYFNRSLKNLQADQIALLVAVVKGASYYNPWRYPERATQRRNVALQLMADNQLITESEKIKYVAKPLGVVKKSALRLGDYPAFLDLVKRQLRTDYRQEDLQSEGLRIFTTLSPNVQELTEQALKKRVTEINQAKKGNDLQAAAVITAVGSGEILALVGDRNPRYSGFNRALDMQRSVGSLVKPFVYLTALAKPEKYTLMTLIDDSAITVPLANGTTWQPKNFSKKSHGEIPLYQALAFSYNQSTARLGMKVGLSEVIDTLKAAGLARSISALPSLLLGSIDLSPVQVSHLYHTLAADGVYTPLRAIREVLDAGHQALQRYPLKSEPRLPAELSYLIHYNLQAAMRTGTGRRVYNQLPSDLVVAGKTGTTNGQRDSWFAGYSGDHLGVVWVGNDDNKPTFYTGSSGALPIWATIFKQLSTRGISYQQPDNIDYYWVDAKDGLLSAENCQDAMLAPFITGSQPTAKTECEFLEAPITRWFKQWFAE
ncbi:MAG: penicillin-binding protein 1B [Kiritimatiellia bacterium]|jgi:penicillin-binding protein 1B